MKFSPTAFLLVIALLMSTVAAAGVDADDRFLAARDAVKVGDRAKLERIAPELKDHDLEAYVDYWRILLDLSSADPAVIKAFLARYEKSYLAEKLRADWLKLLGMKNQWREFDAEYPALAQPDQELSCYALQSRMARGDASVLDDALPLWLNLIEPPASCYPVLEALILEKRVLADAVWARVRRQFEANKLSAARYSMNYLPPSQTPDARVATAVCDTPLPWLVKLPSASLAGSRINRELAVLAISRIARNDPRMASEQLIKIERQLQGSESAWAWSQIGWQAAQRHMSEALPWYRKGDAAVLSDEVAQWKVRAALRALDWGMVRTAIEKMPPALAEQPAWVYWLGRAYRAGGRIEEANALFSRIAGQPNFYGNLADDELGHPIMTPPKAASLTTEEKARVAANAGVRRALALYRVNLRSEGVKEWNWTLRGMSDRELLAASEIAEHAGIFDRAIAAADRTKTEHDYSLRYLSPYSDQVRTAAIGQSLDDAWVYGLMRQESRFVTNAKSTAGASGLMQLMPATAKWVARKIGLKDFHQGQVNDTATNLLLGTTYMRLVMESLDNHPVLASAAYNAGPGRARKWRSDQPLEGAIYAETIPFNETRDYVKKVMSNSVYYSALFDGKPQSIKGRLGVIGPRSTVDPKAEELP
ncbi:lytic transglycosylase domain-containing protein [Propionivibrio sp.]|uniref:lytic transglycosylase domain-containing protein n=1 Tax=Propionivibrio sp. TaxID=2212460 RepID=UPI0025CB9EC0|nr:lytic transglycosylase domain-containing protein [Propionivibrio sp.]MBK7354837.1 lytic transglycosylase domain-containing protein [Propionivibrio sp.]MBK8402205.1 lytic transglycosylase domain-containing protein [Propionivibrio sp.]MBK8745896.1 lytic transglycosylase domain-containing protein [Propionivibrio sp.]MBK8892662.1 lytic transglycosylase domain-containing protein [Propionivibrio sp.]MBL0207447.1 lytic transglycosylase domain-containing protein [Propionivibrio sp.]